MNFILLSILASTTDWIQAVGSAISVLISGITLYFAKSALNSWKEDKFHDYLLEAEINKNKVFGSFLIYLDRIQNLILNSPCDSYIKQIDIEYSALEKELDSLNYKGILIKLSKIKDRNNSIKNSYESCKADFESIQSKIFKLSILDKINVKKDFQKEYAELLEMIQKFLESIMEQKSM